MFRLSYKIIGLSSLNLACGPRAYPSLARGYGPGKGPETCRPGRAWAKHSRSGSGLGLNSSLRAWAGPGLKICCVPEPGLDSN